MKPLNSFKLFDFCTKYDQKRVKLCILVAVIARNEQGFIIDHSKAITRDIKPLDYQCRKDLFELWTPYIKTTTNKHVDTNGETCGKRKRKKQRTSEFNDGEIESKKKHQKIRDIIETSSETLISLGSKAGYFVKQQHCSSVKSCETKTNAKDNIIAVGKDSSSSAIFKDSRERDVSVIQHLSTSPSLVFIQDGWHIIPPETTYLESDASKLQALVDLAKSKGLFDVLVIDPPWYNKSAKRSGKYSFMSLWQIKSLPVPSLLSHDALVVVWVTNKPKYIRFTKEELLPHWGVELLTEWYWVKVTRNGEFVVDLDSPHKKPYETLIIGRCKSAKMISCEKIESSLSAKVQFESTNLLVNNEDKEPLECTTGDEEYMVNQDEKGTLMEATSPRQDYFMLIPNHMVICSVPCQVHSRKPPLNDILANYINKEGRFLEMFARNLTPRWTSWGNEVLKFQHIDYFEETSVKCSS